MLNTAINDKILEVFFEVSRGIREEMTVDCQTSQLTVLQLQALIYINKKKILSMSDIAGLFKISLPTATVLSDKLMNFNLIKRQESKDDRRIVNISLTEKGKSLLKKAMKKRHQKMNKVLSYLSLEDRGELLRILSNLSNNIQKKYEK
jgi:MarR family transcriptional regulator, organic hydroperoxide resistance regulator